MWVLRSVRSDDLDALYQLTQFATRGLTSLQLSREQLLDRIEHSEFAFSRTGLSPRGEPFVLVLCESESDEIAGTSTIYAKTGGYQPFYAYQITQTALVSEQLGIRTNRHALQLTRIHDGPTEIGSLFLRSKFRGKGFGRWLSLARFALIAMMPYRFADRVIAEMRGWANDDGSVPFYEAIAGRFIPVEFAEADALSTVCKQFIEELMPDTPIYLDLLTDSVRKGIGQVHRETEPALKMLKREGFRETTYVDIFDGGPMIQCETDKIDAVSRTKKVRINKIADYENPSDPNYIVCSTQEGFASVMTQIEVNGVEAVISSQAAKTLQLEVGSECSILAAN